MVVNKPIQTVHDFIDVLSQATQQIETLGREYQNQKKINVNIGLEELREALQSCQLSIQEKKITFDPKMESSIEKYLKAMHFLTFLKSNKENIPVSDTSIQEKMAGLMAAFTEAIRLENLFKNNIKNWKIGERIQSTNKSKQS
jgi:hypothetical protein